MEQDMYTEIKANFLASRKGGFKLSTNLLSVVISEIDAIAKTDQRAPTDDDCFKVLRRLEKVYVEHLKLPLNIVDARKAADELAIVQSYLPKMLDAGQIFDAIVVVARNGYSISQKNTGTILKMLNEWYPGRVDGKLVSEAIKNWSV